LNTLGAAQYRMALYEDALKTLIEADRLNKGAPEDIAFLVMTQHRLGQTQAARATFARLREIVIERASNTDFPALLREAEATLAEPAIPADPFAK
jgi:TolA-binding protein